MATAVTGKYSKWAYGTQPPMPRGAVSIEDFFDTRWWDRPTIYNPTGGGGGGAEETDEGAPGFDGTGQDGLGTFGPGWTGIGGGGQWSDNDDYALAGNGEDGQSGGVIVLPPASVAIEASRLHVYRIEVYSLAGARLATVTDWVSGKLNVRLDEASTVKIRVPGNSDAAALLARPNRIYVRDRWGFLIDSFRIQFRDRVREGDAIWYDVTGQSEIVRLKTEVVPVYDQPDETTTVREHIEALLALQLDDDPIVLDDIDDAIAEEAFALHLEDTTIFGALLTIQQILPRDLAGHFFLTPNGQLRWYIDFRRGPERVIAIGGQLTGVTDRTNWDDLINRLYLYGNGQDRSTRLTLVDAGEANEYIEDADSVTAYGRLSRIKIDRRIEKAETLLRVANRVVEEFSTPSITVTVNAADLAKSDEYAANYADLMIAAPYRAVDPGLGIDTSIDLVGMKIDLANPLAVRLELNNSERKLGDFTSDLISALTQPLDVNGDRYPTMGRNFSNGTTPDNLRAGDTRWNTGEDQAEMYDGDSWEPMGGGTPSDDPGTDIAEDDGIAGVADEYARADHTHKGMPFFSESTVGSLPTDHESGILGYVSGTTKQLWAFVDGQWVRLTVPVVTALPPIPDYGVAEVYWTSTGGTGDNQVWRAYAGQTKWVPTQKFTTKSGTP